MSEKPISPLRQRMLEDMNMRRFVPDTQREYIRAVKKLASFLGRSPDTATPEELRAEVERHGSDPDRHSLRKPAACGAAADTPTDPTPPGHFDRPPLTSTRKGASTYWT